MNYIKNFVIQGPRYLLVLDSLIKLKQTKRVRDYYIIGTLAEVLGFNANQGEIALDYLQDYELLVKAVKRWPDIAVSHTRKAVRMIIKNCSRGKIVSEIALDQDKKIQADSLRIEKIRNDTRDYQMDFCRVSKNWKKNNISLMEQHDILLKLANEKIK